MVSAESHGLVNERVYLPIRGDNENINFFWQDLVVTQVSRVHRPRYKLHVSEEIAETYYRSQKLCWYKVRNFFTEL